MSEIDMIDDVLCELSQRENDNEIILPLLDEQPTTKWQRRWFDRVAKLRQMLTTENIGRVVTWRGWCPSGPTFEGWVTWDGTRASAYEIVRKTYRLSFNNAWLATPVFEDEHRRDIAVAEMRMSR